MTPIEAKAAIGFLSARVGQLEDAVTGFLPSNVAIGNDAWPDDTVIPLDVTLGELRALRTALSDGHYDDFSTNRQMVPRLVAAAIAAMGGGE